MLYYIQHIENNTLFFANETHQYYAPNRETAWVYNLNNAISFKRK